ncbi:MAG TPA: nitrite reductase small subunit NirD [Acidobacteriota bacterium]|nr:nitrite reductase small subunit NirD [Acidobacteriota bacterium]
MENGFVEVADGKKLLEGEGIVVTAGNREIALFKTSDGRLFAVDNSCPHRGGPIAEGMLTGSTVTCPWHGWPFDLATGACLYNDAACLESFEVCVEGGRIHVRMSR